MTKIKDEDKAEGKDGILLPVPIVIIIALAILGIILGQLADVIDYCQEEEPRIERIVMRSLSTLGWSFAEWYLLNELWEYRKQKKYAHLKNVNNDPAKP